MVWKHGQTAQAGNTLAENGFLIALVAVASLAGLGTLSITVQQQLGQLFASANITSTSTFDPANPAASISVADLARPLAQGTVTLSPNEAAALQQPTAVLVQTLGANGTTLLASKQLAAQAQQLIDQQNVTPEQSALLKDLANQGHQIASIESHIEAAYSNAQNNSTTFYQTQIPFNGTSYNPYDLADLVGFVGSLPDDPLASDLANTTPPQSEMAKFLTLYQQAKKQGLLKNPAIKKIVDNASVKIAQTGEGMEDALYRYINNPKSATSSTLNEQVASSISNTNASKICNTRYTDSGHQCQ